MSVEFDLLFAVKVLVQNIITTYCTKNDDYWWPKNLTQFSSIKWTLWFGKICVLSTISSARLVHFAKGVITIKHTATTTKTHTTYITTEWARAMARQINLGTLLIIKNAVLILKFTWAIFQNFIASIFIVRKTCHCVFNSCTFQV